MKTVFTSIRWLLGQIIVLIDWITYPVKKKHPGDKQEQLNNQTANMALYQFKLCPFCVSTRRTIRKLGLNIETRDARNDPSWNQELVEQGGKYQVPCLRIVKDDGSVAWMYESKDINSYLNQRFG